ncbi:TPA: hypothetical protein U9G18_000990 [Streptococcus agalactiae]|uniref:LptM family lipoprotein n=1 Tax=Streptococcus anginosus TaxID=1328 RepID=UPI002AD0F00E|nr:hypothetical protein [Streptococcus agalactiae]HEO4923524.1 hypothetical protein [Streptococcus agalactiae]HEO8335395.1 hypothetical protein [Streptococcus agalactiae]HEP2968772.1 hypothetical protein [Streptococcus pyogenes]
MNMKKWFSFLTIGLALVMLVACGQKSTEDIIKTELKDSYIGYSNSKSYQGLMFIGGGDVLTFNKKENSITNSNGEKIYFSVVSEDDIPPATKGVITKLESQLKGTDNFTIITSSKKNPTIKDSEGGYQIALSDGGKTIRIIELYQDYASDGSYYDFSGKAK